MQHNIFSKSKQNNCPFIIPMKVLKLLKKDSVTTGVSPANLKTAKVMPVHKKESKLDFSNYKPISLFSTLDKIFEKLMHNRQIL